MTKQEIIATLNKTMHSIYDQEEQARTLIWNSDFPIQLILDEVTVFFKEKRCEATRNAIEKLLDVMEEEMEMDAFDKALPSASGSNAPTTGIEENWCRTWSSRQFDSE